MKPDVDAILKIEVPLIVRLGQRAMSLGEVLSLMPGTIIEVPKPVEDELEVLINNKVIGTGTAVKVGENFGIRISFIGDVRERIEALGEAGEPEADEDAEAAALAEALLEGQG